MRVRHLGCIVALAAFSLATPVASAKCQLQQIGVMPVDIQASQPLVWVKINGVKARFLLNTGSFYSQIPRYTANQYQLRVVPMPGDSFYFQSPGGIVKADRTTVDSFDFLGTPLAKVQFLVVKESQIAEVAGTMGQNLLRISDVEYDLANGVVRFIKPVGCDGQPLAYWAVNTPYSSVNLHYIDDAHPNLRARATINGHAVSVWFASGSPRSQLSLDAAERLGIATGQSVQSVTFQIGGERVEHAYLQIAKLQPERPVGDVNGADMDMLLGADFFLSHRIYVAYSQNKVYFTYNGGPLFNSNLPQAVSAATTPTASPGTAGQVNPTMTEQSQSDAPTNADGFRRRGMALASMREFDRALADLKQACHLAPHDPDNYYERGVIYAEDSQYDSALQDFDAAITLQPDDIDAHLARAKLLQSHPDAGGAVASTEIKSDLDLVNRLTPPFSDMHRTLAHLYSDLGDYAAATDQIDQWLSHHPLENDQANGLNDRCWYRAEANRDLNEALDDCNRALALRPYGPVRMGYIRPALGPNNPNILDSRGLVYLRLGNLKAAIRDYDSALKVDQRLATSLYGRGLAELRLGEKEQGQNDLAAAEKLDSGIAKRFAGMGLAP